MSPLHLEQGCTWLSAREVFPHASMISSTLAGRDIRQDNVADCSLVTALIVAAEHRAKFGPQVMDDACVITSISLIPSL